MAVIMNRSTNSAPEYLSTSYLIGSAFIGISMITLNSSGTDLPGVTSVMLIAKVYRRHDRQMAKSRLS
jgi:hypothetical protein